MEETLISAEKICIESKMYTSRPIGKKYFMKICKYKKKTESENQS